MKHALAALLCLTALPAAADEVWSTPFGDIVYETVIGDGMGVLSAPASLFDLEAGPEERAMIYVPDLANTDGARGLFDAYWLIEGRDFCPMTLTAPDGQSSTRWGSVKIAFDRPDFPSGFTMIAGYCLWEPFLPARAEPVVGE